MMALNLVEELEEDDEAGWVISLNGLVAILMCFILLLLASFLDQIRFDPFTLQSVVSMWQPNHRFNSHPAEEGKLESRRRMIRKLEEYAETEPNMIFERKLNSIDLPHLGSGVGQLQITFTSIADKKLFDVGRSDLTEGFKSLLSSVGECLASLRKQIDQVKRIEIQVHRNSDPSISPSRSIFSETAKYAFKVKQFLDKNEEFKKYPEDYVEKVDGLPRFAKPKTLSDRMIISSYVDVMPRDEIRQQISSQVVILVSLDLKI